MEISAVNAQSRLQFPNYKNVVPRGQCVSAITPYKFSKGNCSSSNMGWTAQTRPQERTNFKKSFAIKAVQGLEDTQTTTSQFHEFSATTCQTDKTNELKISIEVSGTRTQAVFDDVFSKMVADAQPIPGFRRVKGGKTPNIPKNILLEILGPTKVYKQVIKRVINSTISEYVQKAFYAARMPAHLFCKISTHKLQEGLSVAKDLQVEQSFEELEAMFEPGDQFKFEAIIQCQD